jgi:hypothetical protein
MFPALLPMFELSTLKTNEESSSEDGSSETAAPKAASHKQ